MLLLSEQCISQNKIFDGKILSTRVDKVKLPNGREATREIVEHKPAVGMLALTNHKSVLLVKQYRYAVDEDTLEICAGLIEPGEEPKDAASREMQEEMGYKPGKLIKIGGFYASPGFCTEFVDIFIAEDLSESKLPQDDDEDVHVQEVAYKDIPKLMADGTIRDSKTYAALAWLMAREKISPEF